MISLNVRNEDVTMQLLKARYLKTHQRKHRVDLLRCEEPGCDYTTTHVSSLKAHQRKHTGELFRCDEPGCDYTSTQVGNLKAHKGNTLVISLNGRNQDVTMQLLKLVI